VRESRTYAQAVFETAAEDWVGVLKEIQERLKKDNTISRLDDLSLTFEKKKRILSKALPKETQPEVRNFLSLLAKENRVHLLGEIIADLEHIITHGPEAEIAHVTSAVPLTEREKEALKGKLKRRFGKNLGFRFHLDPSILGGVIVRAGDKVIDGSLATKLEALRESLILEH
jgi:F-type H+-transporting ATPase subunit delta